MTTAVDIKRPHNFTRRRSSVTEKAQEALRAALAVQKQAEEEDARRKQAEEEEAKLAVLREIQKDNLARCPSEALKNRLNKLKEESKDGDSKAETIMQRAKEMRNGLKDTLESCHKTIEVSGKCLADHFRNIPAWQLDHEIASRFKDFDVDGSGSLDKEELREALAEMGQRPSDSELGDFFEQCDKDGNGMIDLAEFSAMVRVKLGLIDAGEMETVATEMKKALKQRDLGARRRHSIASPSGTLAFGRRSSVSDAGHLPSLPSLSRRPSNEHDVISRTRSVSVEGGYSRHRAGNGDANLPSGWAVNQAGRRREAARDFARSNSSEGAEAGERRFRRRGSVGVSSPPCTPARGPHSKLAAISPKRSPRSGADKQRDVTG